MPSKPWEDFQRKDPSGPWNDYKQQAPAANDAPETPQGPVAGTINAAASAALPSGDALQPIQPTSSNPIAAGGEAALQTLRDPTRISPSISQGPTAAGDAVQNSFSDPSSLTAKTAGFATSTLLDPQTYIGTGEASARIVKSIGETVEAGLPKLYKWMAKVPERATDIALEKKWKLPDVSPVDIEQGVKNVQSALLDAKNSIGKDLNAAKADLGIPVTSAEKEAAIVKYGNAHGIGAPDLPTGAPTEYLKSPKSPEELVAKIADFKAKAPDLTPNTRGKLASYLQDQISGFVNYDKPGNQVEGVLKSQYGDLTHIITTSSDKLTAAKSKMSSILNVFDELESKLADKDKSGKAEQFLRTIFVGKNPTSKDYLQKLAMLEQLSGKPVVTDLFEKLAGESYQKLIGRSTGAHIAEVWGAGDVISGHPMAALAKLGYLASQSPKVLGTASKVASSVPANLAKRAGVIAAMTRIRQGFPLDQGNMSQLQSVRDKLRNGE